MKITNELIEFLDKFNGKYEENQYIESGFRVYYVIRKEDRRIVNAICINRESHRLAQANKIRDEFMRIMYDENYVCEYTGQIIEKQIEPIESTGKNKYLEHLPSLYIM